MAGYQFIKNFYATVRRLQTTVTIACAVFLLLGFNPAALAQPPQDIVLMLDNSGSMRKNDPDFLTRVAVTTFINELKGDVQVAIIMFDQNVRQLMPLTQLNDATRQDFLKALDALDYHGLLTNSPAALEKSTYELRTKGRSNSQKSIIFMTDGIVDVGKDGFDEGDVEKARWMKTTLVDEAAKYQIRIYGIAYTDNADFELIQTLSSKTGGEYYRAADAAEIESVFETILGTLSQQPASVAAPPVPESPAPAQNESVRDDTQTPTTAITEEPTATDNSLPETDSALPETSTDTAELPETTLPESTLPALPESTLPESTLPEATGTSATSPESTPQPVDATATATSESTATTTEPAATQPPVEGSAASEPAAAATATAVPAVPAETTQNLPVAMLAGAAGLLLALIAIVLFLIKHKSTPAKSSADSLMPKAFLNDVANVTGKNSYELGEKPTIIGRLQGTDPLAANYIVIDESTIGRRHSLIEYREYSFWVADQNSLNGTFVNNKRIESSTRLKHGDRLRFHNHEFEFVILDMMETDRTMMSQTQFAERTSDLVDEDDDEDATQIRDDRATDNHEPNGEDETIRRPEP